MITPAILVCRRSRASEIATPAEDLRGADDAGHPHRACFSSSAAAPAPGLSSARIIGVRSGVLGRPAAEIAHHPEVLVHSVRTRVAGPPIRRRPSSPWARWCSGGDRREAPAPTWDISAGPDPAGVVRLRLPALVLNYFGQGAAAQRAGGDRKPVLPPRAVVGDDPAGGARHPGHGHRPAGGDLGRLLGGPPVGADGLLPRMLIVHTSGQGAGQIYVPFTNWTLYLAGRRPRGRLPELVEPGGGPTASR